MKKLPQIKWLSLLVLLFPQLLLSQNQKTQFDAVYGLDSKLYNGYIYNGQYGSKVGGSPFLYEDFEEGSLSLEDKEYQHIWLNYDIYNQKVVLKFVNNSGAWQHIEIPLFKLDHFSIGEHYFKMISKNDSSFQIYQSIGQMPYMFYVSHHKNMNLENASSQYEYRFSKDFTQVFWWKDELNVIELKRNKSLLENLNKEQQQTTRKWLRQNKMKVQKATYLQLELLSQYLHQL